jgi:thiol:disulfide interchange protein
MTTETTPTPDQAGATAPADRAATDAAAADTVAAATVARRPRPLVVALAAAAAVLVVAVVAVIAFRGNDAKPAGSSTSPTAFVLPALDGSGQVRLADFRGKPTVVNLFASWCDVCDLELPGFCRLPSS